MQEKAKGKKKKNQKTKRSICEHYNGLLGTRIQLRRWVAQISQAGPPCLAHSRKGPVYHFSLPVRDLTTADAGKHAQEKKKTSNQL